MPLVQVVCETCGKVFNRYVCPSRPAKHTFCSKVCHGTADALAERGVNNPYWRGGKSKFSCGLCGKEFLSYQSERGRGGAVFCSRSCSSIYRKRRETRACAICGKSFEAMKCEIDKGKGRFCSQKCFGEWFSANLVGSDSPHYREKSRFWKGGVRMEEGYVTIRTDDQRYEYQHRQIAEKALGRKLKKGEVVHHINGDKSDNRNENLLVCTNAYHRWLHERMSALYMKEHFPPKPQPDATASAQPA